MHYWALFSVGALADTVACTETVPEKQTLKDEFSALALSLELLNLKALMTLLLVLKKVREVHVKMWQQFRHFGTLISKYLQISSVSVATYLLLYNILVKMMSIMPLSGCSYIS